MEDNQTLHSYWYWPAWIPQPRLWLFLTNIFNLNLIKFLELTLRLWEIQTKAEQILKTHEETIRQIKRILRRRKLLRDNWSDPSKNQWMIYAWRKLKKLINHCSKLPLNDYDFFKTVRGILITIAEVWIWAHIRW